MANKDRSFGFNYTDWWSRFENHHLNKTEQESKKIVGGSEQYNGTMNQTLNRVMDNGEGLPQGPQKCIIFSVDGAKFAAGGVA
ncbi:unnamed protein product [Lupinus luteus]|uniref:Uncharacterized protein n=1 Tax=Lupinus luteus TaxID=3873 RepID=A0AAV1WWD1_LUPLU